MIVRFSVTLHTNFTLEPWIDIGKEGCIFIIINS